MPSTARRPSAASAGDGPGEFRDLRGVTAFRGDSILAWDSRAGFSVGRISVFTASGDFARTLPTAELRVGDVFGVTEGGILLTEPQSSTPADWMRPESGVYRMPRIYQTIAPSGDPLVTLGPVPGNEWVSAPPERTAIVYFGRNTYVAVGKRAVFIGDNARFEIAVHDAEGGEVLRHVRRPFGPIPVTAEEIAFRHELGRRSDSLMRARPASAATERLFARRIPPEEIPANETHPAFNRIVEDPDENLWVRHAVPAQDSVQTWSVFDADGAWLGEVDFPREMSVRAIGRNEIAFLLRDELRVEYVVLYRLLK